MASKISQDTSPKTPVEGDFFAIDMTNVTLRKPRKGGPLDIKSNSATNVANHDSSGLESTPKKQLHCKATQVGNNVSSSPPMTPQGRPTVLSSTPVTARQGSLPKTPVTAFKARRPPPKFGLRQMPESPAQDGPFTPKGTPPTRSILTASTTPRTPPKFELREMPGSLDRNGRFTPKGTPPTRKVLTGTQNPLSPLKFGLVEKTKPLDRNGSFTPTSTPPTRVSTPQGLVSVQRVQPSTGSPTRRMRNQGTRPSRGLLSKRTGLRSKKTDLASEKTGMTSPMEYYVNTTRRMGLDLDSGLPAPQYKYQPSSPIFKAAADAPPRGVVSKKTGLKSKKTGFVSKKAALANLRSDLDNGLPTTQFELPNPSSFVMVVGDDDGSDVFNDSDTKSGDVRGRGIPVTPKKSASSLQACNSTTPTSSPKWQAYSPTTTPTGSPTKLTTQYPKLPAPVSSTTPIGSPTKSLPDPEPIFSSDVKSAVQSGLTDGMEDWSKDREFMSPLPPSPPVVRAVTKSELPQPTTPTKMRTKPAAATPGPKPVPRTPKLNQKGSGMSPKTKVKAVGAAMVSRIPRSPSKPQSPPLNRATSPKKPQSSIPKAVQKPIFEVIVPKKAPSPVWGSDLKPLPKTVHLRGRSADGRIKYTEVEAPERRAFLTNAISNENIRAAHNAQKEAMSRLSRPRATSNRNAKNGVEATAPESKETTTAKEPKKGPTFASAEHIQAFVSSLNADPASASAVRSRPSIGPSPPRQTSLRRRSGFQRTHSRGPTTPPRNGASFQTSPKSTPTKEVPSAAFNEVDIFARTPSPETASALDEALDQHLMEQARLGREFTLGGQSVRGLLERRGLGSLLDEDGYETSPLKNR